MTYHVRLTLFEGPLDLLLHLIRRDKINIYDIPISRITREYLSYIEIMQELELEVAGEFFVMAASLMRIKSQMLLPRREGTGEEEEDPRDELVRNLIEYRTFKEAAQCLAEKEGERRRVYTRAAAPPPEEAPEVEEPEGVSIFELLEALQAVFKNMKTRSIYHIVPEAVTVEQKIEAIEGALSARSEVLFSELFAGEYARIEVIVTFLAILEMIKLGRLSARQLSHGEDIWLYRPQPRTYSETGGSTDE
jgi:segregation and condensation protein A